MGHTSENGAGEHQEPAHPGLSLGEYLHRHLKQHAARCTAPAQVDAASGAELSFPELLLLSVRAALGLRRLGLRCGDVLAFFTRNSNIEELFPTLAGAFLEGVTVACVNPISTDAELLHSLSLVRPRAVLSESGFNTDRALRCAAPGTLHLVSGEGEGGGVVTLRALRGLGEQQGDDPQAYSAAHVGDLHEHIAAIMFSSGSTGPPKAVAQSNFGFVMDCMDSSTEWKALTSDRLLVLSWLSWTTGIICNIKSMLGGTTRIVANYTSAKDIVSIIERHQVGGWLVTPPLLVLFVEAVVELRAQGCSPDLSSLQCILTGGGPINAATQSGISETLGVPVLQGYGCTECGIFFLNTLSFTPRSGSVGLPRPWARFRIVDVATNRDIHGPNEVGEIRVWSLTRMKEYLGNPEATAKAFDAQGFYCTGDLGYRDKDGFVFLVDRMKEMLKYDSWAIAPVEIEGVLLTHPAVKEACVVGTPHPRLGDLPTAFVSLRRGRATTVEELQELVAGKLSDCKRLRGGVFFEEELSKMTTGKLDRQHYKTILKSQIIKAK